MQLVGIIGYMKPVNVEFVLFTVNVIIVIVTSYLNFDIYIYNINNYGIPIELFSIAEIKFKLCKQHLIFDLHEMRFYDERNACWLKVRGIFIIFLCNK